MLTMVGIVPTASHVVFKYRAMHIIQKCIYIDIDMIVSAIPSNKMIVPNKEQGSY